MLYTKGLAVIGLKAGKSLPKIMMRLCSIFVAVLFCLITTGCGNHALLAGLMPEVAAAGQIDRQQVLDYLTKTVDDLSVIDAILSDTDLDLLGEGAGEAEEMTDAMIQHYDQLLKGYRNGLSEAGVALTGRSMPDLEDLRLCRATQIALFEMTDDLLEEYSQVLTYSATMLEVASNLESADFFDEDDLYGTYETISTAIQTSVELLENVEVPSFLIYMNQSMTDALRQMDDAVLYLLQALYFEDPLQTSAAIYRLDILTRYFDKIGTNVAEDMADRQDKLFEEIERISWLKDGLQTWETQNIDLLRRK